MKQEYRFKAFQAATLTMLDTINDIVEDYESQGFRLTVRQLYYQLVAKDIIPNTLQEYKRIASIINDGKEAGLVDWDAIEDRTRDFVRQQRWINAKQILEASVSSYRKDLWVEQESRVFVIVEKEALVGVLEPTCHKYDVPLLAARGYPSGTVLREFAQSDLIQCIEDGQVPVILHLGDHDPSGLDMTRDLRERISMFAESGDVELRRIALNMHQIQALKPPENPAKVTDSRFTDYAKQYGTKSWELDALSPSFLANLLENEITQYINWTPWRAIEAEVAATKAKIVKLAAQFK